MKVLIFQRIIPQYRVPFYNALNEKVDLTVAYYMDEKLGKGCQFKTIKLKEKIWGPIHIQKGVKQLAKQYDVVAVGTDLHAINYIMIPFRSHKYKLLSWGIGFRASHSHPYLVERKHNFLDRITEIILSKCDANVFYMPQAKLFWKGTSLDQEKMFVAPNTVEVANVEYNSAKKKNIAFVGTLYKSKGVDALLRSIDEAKKVANNSFFVDIVGDGPCRQELEELRDNLNLQDCVKFHGSIFDRNALGEIYANAICCVSPHQAGLSVCTSMGNGVPFITQSDSITGGEIFHITNGENGVLYKNDDELTEIIVDVINNPSKFVEMGKRAQSYYDNNATIQHMVEGFMSAINYAVNH